MPLYHRRKPSSTKQRRGQIKAKRERKRNSSHGDEDDNYEKESLDNKMQEAFNCGVVFNEVEEINAVPNKQNRYNLKFHKEKNEEIRLRKENQTKPIVYHSPADLEFESNSFFPQGLDFPKRPDWNPSMSKLELDQNENRYFRLLCNQLDQEFEKSMLSRYELNLETWRQLWRVMEMSDVLLIIVDCRFSVSQFPPYLYEYLAEKCNKGVVLVLNKCDLVPPPLVLAWKHYFEARYPKLKVSLFSSWERNRLRQEKLKMAAESATSLLHACKSIIGNKVDLASWEQKIEAECMGTFLEEDFSLEEPNHQSKSQHYDKPYGDGILTLGTIGNPNVGKSSLINALRGQKVVSVSRTPGHTKHFQTIYITKTVKLCDCPGLVFPSTCPKILQVIQGSYPISQCRDPVGCVGFIASCIPIQSILKLEPHVEDYYKDESGITWTPFNIAEAWAKKRGYFTKHRGGHLDVSRAANELLRFSLMGSHRLIVLLKPPGYSMDEELYKRDPELLEVHRIQGIHSKWQQDAEEEDCGEGEVVSEDNDEEETPCDDDIIDITNRFIALPEG